MKKIVLSAFAASLMTASVAQADWFGGSDDPWDDNDWPEWTPMYWMEEMMDEWDDDDDDKDYYRYGYGPRYGYGSRGGYGAYPPPPAPYYPYSAPPPAPRDPEPVKDSKEKAKQ